MIAVIDRAAIMPVADAGICLPWQRFNAVGGAALDVPHNALPFGVIELLAEDDRLQFAAMLRHAMVVKIRRNFQTGITDRP